MQTSPIFGRSASTPGASCWLRSITAGCRDVLNDVWQADWRSVNVGLLLHLHRWDVKGAGA